MSHLLDGCCAPFCPALPLIAGLAIASPVLAQKAQPDAEPEKQRRSSVVQRGPVTPAGERNREDRGQNRGGNPDFEGMAEFPFDVRSIDGWGNNIAHPDWGSVGIHFKRTGPNGYADGLNAPAGPDRPSARHISNALHEASGDRPNSRGASDILWQWGQFLDHDITETPVSDPAEEFDIAVPLGDAWFDPFADGDKLISMDRSAGDLATGVRQQLNNITAFVDASNVYGSEHELADWLRTNDGTGRLKVSEGDLLPFNTDGFHNAPTDDDPSFFLAGDIRANEQIGLIAFHTLFVREHNYWADRIAAETPFLSGDEIYEEARAIVAAEMQAITYNEFLPLLLGPNALPPYQGYRPDVDPSITNEFATAAYRVGHTMLSSNLQLRGADGGDVFGGQLSLADSFFVPWRISVMDIDPVLRGLAAQPAQEIDTEVVDDVRNFLFGPPGAGGFDLVSLNVQRGRDHGLCSYNELRVAMGLPAANSFADINPDAAMQARLAAAYDSPADVDAWPGLLAEPHRPGAMVGETMYRVLRQQFARLRDGDRFWYQGYLPPHMVRMVNLQTLGVVMRRNTDIWDELQHRVFLVDPGNPADTNRDGQLTGADLNAFLNLYNQGRPAADQNQDGQLNGADFNAWLNNFFEG